MLIFWEMTSGIFPSSTLSGLTVDTCSASVCEAFFDVPGMQVVQVLPCRFPVVCNDSFPAYVPLLQLINKVVYTPVVAQSLIPIAFLFETIEIPFCRTQGGRRPCCIGRAISTVAVCGETVVLPQPQLVEKIVAIRRRLFPCRDSEVDSHGPACLADHRDFAVAVRVGWSMSLLRRSCWIPGAVVKETVEISQVLLLRNRCLPVVLAALRGGVGMKRIFQGLVHRYRAGGRVHRDMAP